MKSLNILLLFAALTVQFVHSEKILVISFFSSKSHKITYMRLIEELASRGHEITVVTPIKGSKVKNIKEIFTLDLDKLMEEKFHFNAFEMKEKGEQLDPFFLTRMLTEVCTDTYDLPVIKELQKEKFDLIFMQPMFNDCVLGLVYRLGAPLVLFSPTSAPDFMISQLGGHLPPSFVGNVFLGYSDEMTFFQRFKNLAITIFVNAVIKFHFEPAMTEIYREKLGQDIPSSSEIFGNASLLLSNGHFSLNKPKPYLPDVIDVAGIHSQAAKPLPKDLEEFVSKSKEGFILFSMGSAIRGELMSDEKRQLFLNVFSKLKQNVLWKWETEEMPNLPKNVKLSKWLPQQDLLGHKNIRMFITHCGGGSTEEAIYHGVPLVGLPMFGDQIVNSLQAEKRGYLVERDWAKLTEENLMEAIQEILNNKKYKENVQRLSNVFKDQPNDPLERGVYWVEYVLRHKGAPQLRSASRKLNFFQYHSLDVIGAYLAIISAAIYIIYGVLKFILRTICKCLGFSSGKKVTSGKKNK